nr:hypothetical protein BaRGS_001660 [Batillaria attramentaria]
MPFNADGNAEAKGGSPSSGSSASNSHSKLSTRKVSNGGGGKASRGKKSAYKHVPHALKPVHLVAKRNARERRRVQAVNSAFIRLRKHVPYEPRHKRLSKVKTLRVAITYISHLQDLIRDHDRRVATARSNNNHSHNHYHLHHHHHHNHNNPNLDILADADAPTSTTGMTSDDRSGVTRFDDDFHFLNGGGGGGGGGGGSVTSQSSHLHHSGHAPLHLHGRHGSLPGPGVEPMHSSWVDGLHYTSRGAGVAEW